MNKRLLSLVLALAMSLSLAAPTTAFAAESTEEPVTVYADEAAENTPADTENEPGTEPEQPTQPVEKLPQEITGVKTAYNLYMTKLDYALRPVTNGGGALTFATSDPGVVTVDETTGLLTPVAVGTATITITAGAEGRSPATSSIWQRNSRSPSRSSWPSRPSPACRKH